MSAATATIIAGASIAASAATAKMQANAAKKAAQQQSQAADRAMASQERGYNQQRQDFSPYQQVGAGAMARLGQTAGTYQGGAPTTPPPATGQLGMPPQPSQMGGGQGLPMAGGPMQGGPMPGGPPQSRNAGPSMGQMGQPAPPALRRVRAPTGEIQMLPDEIAQQAVQKGAQIVG